MAKSKYTVEELFKIVSNNVTDIFVITDLKGKLLLTNASYDKLFGTSRAHISKDIFAEIHSEDQAKVKSFLRKVIKSGISQQVSYRQIMQDGNTCLLESKGIIIRDEKGKPINVAIISRDLTGVIQSEKQIRLLAQAVSCTKDAFILTDMNNNFLFINQAACEMYGYSEEELLGKNIEVVRSNKNLPEIIQQIVPKTLEGGWNGELINCRKDGTEFLIELWTTVVSDEVGEPIAMVGVARNISQRRQAEKQLQDTTQRLQVTLDNLSGLAYELDADGKILLSRGKGLEKLGLQPDQHVGQSLFDLYRGNLAMIQLLRNVYNGAPGRGEVEAGGFFWDTNFFPVKDSAGSVERVFGTAVDVTERRRAEEALIRESELLHTLMDNIPDTIYFKDIHSRFTRINKAQAQILGIRNQDDAVGRTDADYFSQEHASVAFNDEQKIIKTGNPLLGKIEKVETKDGRKCWFSTTKVPMRDKEGKIVGLVGSSRDITELKQAEELESALYNIAEKTSGAADLQKLFSAIHSIIDRLMYAKNFYIALYDKEIDLLTFPYFVDDVDIVPPEPQRVGKGLTAYVLRTGKSLLCDQKVSDELERCGEAELVGAPSPIWLGVPLVVEGKTIGAMVVQHYSDPNVYGKREQHILEFVSSQVAKAIEYKRSEEALHLSETKYRTLFEESQDCIILSTPEGKMIDANPAGVQLFGYSSKEEFLNIENANKLYFNPDDREVFKDQLNRQGFVKNHEVVVRRKDDEKIVVLENSSSVRDVDGNIVAYRSFLRDITERKKLEEQLRQAQKMEGIGTLAGGIAHEFNNLLGIILGYTSLLESGKLDSTKFAQSLDTIKKAVQRGASLVRQLLTFARKSEPTFETIIVNDIVNELIKILDQTFPRTITIEGQLSNNLPPIVADSNQVHQALLNLCVNARDAMTDNKPGSLGLGTLTLQTGLIKGEDLRPKFSVATSDIYIFVSVSDTGMGMDEAVKSRLFEPFFTTKELGKGTGLGLAVVYGVVNSHHGFVDVQSTKGTGTTFTLYFPVPEQTLFINKQQEKEGQVDPKGSETILIVEDEEMLVTLLSTILEDQGYQVLTAKDGIEGIDMYKKYQEQINLVLSDMGLPRLGGYEMFMKMKELNPGVKVILASGYFEPNLKKDLISAGAKDFLQKPYVTEIVLQRIREILDEDSH